MGTLSATTHEFHLENIDNDDSCLYTSMRHVNGNFNVMDNKRLRSMVADYIRRNMNLHSAVLERGTTCQTVADYCNQIEKGKLRGGEPEVRALAMLCRILIRLVMVTKTIQGNVNITIAKYGEYEESFNECVYILYDEENQHYYPLYVIKKDNPDEKLTIFERDDQVVLNLLRKFIQEELHDDGFMQLDCCSSSYETELSTETNLLNQTGEIADLIAPNAILNQPRKRKLPDYDHFLSAPTTEIEWSPSTSNKLGIYEISVDDKTNSESIAIEEYLQMEFFADESLITDVSTTSNHEHQEEEMRFEVEPALKFRGRTEHEFKPKKALNRKGKQSKPRPPRYFKDRNHRRYLNLLIPETHLSAGLFQICLEICIVTPEIDGYTYIHPYFKFQVHPTDRESPNLNPKYVFLDRATKLKAYSKVLRQLKLQLVVVMHTNRELMQTKQQTLKIYSSPENSDNGLLITTKFGKAAAFKKAYRLLECRFAVTLWKKQSGEKVFHRHNDIQYISQISIEDKKYKSAKDNT